MALELVSLCFGAVDPPALAGFWAAALRWELAGASSNGAALVPAAGTPFDIRFLPVAEPKVGKNRIHLDLTSTSVTDQRATVERLLALGARLVDIGQGDDADHVVLADPEGNELCVVQPGNFVDDGGFVGSITCDASGPDVGYFWSAALGWPLVWDQDDETAIRAPDGTGPYLTWGPPLPLELAARNRLHLDVAPSAGGDQASEVARLVGLGARHVGVDPYEPSRIVLLDPDDNEFGVLPHRPAGSRGPAGGTA